MSEGLMERVLQSPRLPSLPTIALEVIDLVQQRDVNIKQIATTIQHDPALSSKILKTVNSSFYGQAHTISTISHALVVLGLNSVKTLALGFSLVGNLSNEGGADFDHMTFWKRSLYAATAAKQLAAARSLVQQEEAFLGGLLQDLGMLAMYQTLGAEYRQVLAATNDDHRLLTERERQALGIDHSEVGGKLAESWNLPPLLIAPIRYHHCPESAPEEVRALVECVAVGNDVAELFLREGQEAEASERCFNAITATIGVSEADADPLLRLIHKQTQEMRRLFDLPTGGLGNPDEILAAAHEALTNISLQQTMQANVLEQENMKLIDEANTDPLTGVANRRRFTDFVKEKFDESGGDNGPLSVLFLDADHFKKFNDTYGHAVGDRVLIKLGEVLTEHVDDAGLVCRYGGEEFAVILPGTDRKSAAQTAERLRVAIGEAEVASDEGESLHITASIGVATETGGVFKSADALVKAADQGVYAAKASGRNCVRVYAPRPKQPAAA
ncbi:MAG: GGDEF domain-containing protein [Planctomycetota bacterium]